MSNFWLRQAAPVDGAVTSEQAHDAVAPKIAIVYDSVVAGHRAVGMAKRMLDETGDATDRVPAVWRFDLLGEPGFREQAASDAVAADLVILATERPQALPTSVENWVSAFLARRRGTPVTILAMWGMENEWTISLYERNEHGRMQPTTSSAGASVNESGRAAFQASPFEAALIAA